MEGTQTQPRPTITTNTTNPKKKILNKNREKKKKITKKKERETTQINKFTNKTIFITRIPINHNKKRIYRQ